MADRITWSNQKRKLGDLLPWPRNPRTINNAQATRLVESVDEFGQVETLAIGPGNEIYNGHQRLSVLRGQYGADYEVDVRVSSRPLSEKEREKLTVYLHKGAAGEWDMDTLASEFEMDDLLAWGFEPFELGLSDLEDEPKGEDPGADVSKADELQAVWNVQPGDLWQLGDHRLICGDCTDAATVARLMGGEKAQGVFTSPPYAEQRKNTYGGIPTDEYVEWWKGIQLIVRAYMADSGSFFVNIKPHCEDRQRVLYVFDLVLAMVRQWGWRFTDELCWTHQGFPGEPQDRFQNAFEPVYHFCPTMGEIKFRPDSVAYESDSVIQYEQGLNLRQRERSTARLSDQKEVKYGKGKAYPRNVLRISSAASDMPDHPAAFPVDLPSFFIKAYSDLGDIWLEPFSGSGTTIIACEQLGRRCRAVELHPPYVAVALQRWADMTGQMPVRIEPGV